MEITTSRAKSNLGLGRLHTHIMHPTQNNNMIAYSPSQEELATQIQTASWQNKVHDRISSNFSNFNNSEPSRTSLQLKVIGRVPWLSFPTLAVLST